MKTAGKQNTDSHTSVTRRNISFLENMVTSSPQFQDLCTRMDADPRGSLTLCGLHGSLPSLVVSALSKRQQHPVLVICSPDLFDLYDNDLSLLPANGRYFTAADEFSAALSVLWKNEPCIILAEYSDLSIPLRAPSTSKNRICTLETGAEAGYDTLIAFLNDNSYTRKEFIDNEGEFSTRGSIIDIFPFGSRQPVRLEFFGDTVTSIRTFDLNSQLSKKNLPSVELTGNFLDESERDTNAKTYTLPDYLPPQSLVFIDDETGFTALENHSELEQKLEPCCTLRLNRLEEQQLNFGSSPQSRLNANFTLFAQELSSQKNLELQTIFAGSSKKEIEELAEFIAEETTGETPVADIDINWIAANLHTGFRFHGCDVYSESDIFGKLHTHRQHRRKALKGISLKELQRLKVGDYIVHEDYGVGIFKALETIQAGDSEQECVLIEYDRGDQLYVNVQNIRLLSKYSASEGSAPGLSRLGSTKWKTKKDKVKKRLKDIASKLIKLYAKRKMTPGFAFGEDSIFQREFEASFIFDETPDQLKAIEDVKKDMQASSPMDRLICGDAGFGKTEIAMRAAFKAIESKKQVAILTPTTILAHQHGETFARRFANFPINIAVLSRFVSRKEQQKIVRDLSLGLIDIVIGTHRLVSKDVVFQDLGLLVIDEEQHFGVAVKEKLRQSFPGVDTLTMSATPIPRTLQFSMLGARDLSIVSTPPKNRQPVETVITGFDHELLQSAIQSEINRSGQVFVLHNRISGLEEIMATLKSLVPGARMAYAHGQMPSAELETIMMDFMNHELDVLISTSIIGSGLDISNANTIIINRADMFGLSDLYQLRGRVGRSDRKAYSYLITPPLHTLKQDALQRLAVIESFTELGSGFSIAMRDLDIRGAGNLLGAEQSGAIHELGFDLYQKLLEEAVAELKTGEFSDLFDTETHTPDNRSCDLNFFFDALIPDHYVTSAQERFRFYDRVSRAADQKALDNITSELQDRFGQLPDEVRHLLALASFKAVCTGASLAKIDIQRDSTTLTLPDQENELFYSGEFFRNLVGSVQAPWMQKYRPQFKQGRKMRLVLHHPDDTPSSPLPLLEEYTLLIEKLNVPAEQAES
ncbi:transcription-repair coupling factor [Prosthecochloris sp. N3]|uniref:Transcription-repair-coupling factor n=1 Tax=Prosthecochloris ethylica TaxID=2743976 RepID=A0ABR9XRP1_9CHLB|nr:transcription-repair coupling factor [Prosthecochloris ethylica]MBF0636717.1 transcription-repair coupling factor [Prosthecochloris ethylica]NUK48553.1 transcription-repair coupling factor [Prosthecochloris ethylica]